jgi:hypothetical protein
LGTAIIFFGFFSRSSSSFVIDLPFALAFPGSDIFSLKFRQHAIEQLSFPSKRVSFIPISFALFFDVGKELLGCPDKSSESLHSLN